MNDIDLTTLPVRAGQPVCPRCGGQIYLEVTRISTGVTPYSPETYNPDEEGSDTETYVTDAYCQACDWAYLDDAEDAADEAKDLAESVVNAVTLGAMETALIAAFRAWLATDAEADCIRFWAAAEAHAAAGVPARTQAGQALVTYAQCEQATDATMSCGTEWDRAVAACAATH